jgi:hypothetical protein
MHVRVKFLGTLQDASIPSDHLPPQIPVQDADLGPDIERNPVVSVNLRCKSSSSQSCEIDSLPRIKLISLFKKFET